MWPLSASGLLDGCVSHRTRGIEKSVACVQAHLYSAHFKPRCLLPFFTFTSKLINVGFFLKKKRKTKKEEISQENIKCLIALSATYAPICKLKRWLEARCLQGLRGFKNIREIHYDGADIWHYSIRKRFIKRK